jgi:hypothetical protein
VPGREDYEALRVRYRVVPMMDVLFRAQEVLFRLRDPRRALYEAEDEEEAANEAAANEAAAAAQMATEAVTESVREEALVAAAE